MLEPKWLRTKYVLKRLEARPIANTVISNRETPDFWILEVLLNRGPKSAFGSFLRAPGRPVTSIFNVVGGGFRDGHKNTDPKRGSLPKLANHCPLYVGGGPS